MVFILLFSTSFCDAHSVCPPNDRAEHTKHIGYSVVHFYRSFRLVWLYYIIINLICPIQNKHYRL